MLRPIASSLPLGFFAFTAGTVLLTVLELGWVPVTDTAQLAVLVPAFVVPPGALSLPLAVFLLTLTALMLVMSAASVTGKPLFGLLLLIGACRFALTGVYQATGNVAVEHAAGWLGVPLGAFALYGGLALLLEESAQRMVLPIGRRGRSRTSLEGAFAHQVHPGRAGARGKAPAVRTRPGMTGHKSGCLRSIGAGSTSQRAGGDRDPPSSAAEVRWLSHRR